ncbi:hypothetical protein DMN91_006750 [Ooceraea biroi]|uniref:F-box/WD repeat-containing protein n=1 Tax=Ooceraea biroi TaxID=2015173 RepID=A0A026X3J2_OOCBI|nr:F-box/WD repeat-containing protein 4 [Ooceraea biroi]EZA62628.1 F-box/WD repeat-containing protein [Ooceraea biroi]RLU20144.1 hypothetical protein DMN91_006750 [Ooceraea biroi]
MTDSWRLDILPCEILLAIFDYCDVIDLLRISQVCKRFNEIIHTDGIWVKKSNRSIVTNQISERFRKICNPILLPRNKCFVSYNWQYGKYKKNFIFYKRRILMPWLQMTKEMLWWCGGNNFVGIERRDQLTQKNRDESFSSHNLMYMPKEFSKFVLWKNFIISGHSDGRIIYWLDTSCKTGPRLRILTSVKNVHPSYISAIDATSRNVISASHSMIRIQKNISTLAEQLDEQSANHHSKSGVCIGIKDRVQSLAIDPTETKFAVGSGGWTDFPPLHIIDINKHHMSAMVHKWRHGAGILDMVWDNPHTLLTCGYDSHIRKWDLRVGKCVSSWADPNDATLYCISSDYQYTMITGTQYTEMAVLWDQRQRNFVQVYYVNPRSAFRSSPIYSLRFDSSHLYCAMDRYLVELNFSDHLCQKNDYKMLYNLYDRNCEKQMRTRRAR